jgi:saccharopine dehydrogenase (NAD+, L-lysine forming)
MKARIGIRHEDKYTMERRSPLTPEHVKQLVSNHGLSFSIQSSEKRIFKDDEYLAAGAQIVNELSDCDIIMGVKEIPVEAFEAHKTYIFFSHVIKGQYYNMPMLGRMMELGCNLIDYERIVDEQNRRLIFFGRFAGLAGMINSLWSLGQRLELQGYAANVFSTIKQSFRYDSLEEAMKEIALVGEKIRREGLPEGLVPLTIGFTGYGNVSKGAQEIVDLLPIQEITPEELLVLNTKKKLNNKTICKIVFQEKHISKPTNDNVSFDLQDYYSNPDRYENNFEQFIPHLTVLMNCMYWDKRYPKLFTRGYVKELFNQGEPKIRVVGDITCDPDGSIEFTHQGTEIENPVFVYNPFTGEPTMGFEGVGILVMAVDILPSELARDASVAFGDALTEYIKPIADTDFSKEFAQLDLPEPFKKALILHKGNLTPEYTYIEQYLRVQVDPR